MQDIRGDDFYNEVINPSYKGVILVEFWAPWCGPCRGLMAILEEIEKSEQYPVRFKKMNVDEYVDTALEQKVMGVPHTKIFVSGHQISSFSDTMSKHDIELWLKASLLIPLIFKYSHFQSLEIPVAEYVQDLENAASGGLQGNWYALLLAQYFLTEDQDSGKKYLEQIADESEFFEDKLFLRELYQLVQTKYGADPAGRKLWAARNALLKRNFESTYQFLLQAARIENPDQEKAKLMLVAFRQYLGNDHELNRKYQSQFDQIVQ